MSPGTKTFYRIAKRFPPAESEYRTKRQKDGDPPPGSTVAIQRAYDGLSVFDSEEGARRTAKRIPVLGTRIVRYHVPANADFYWEKSFGEGHFTLSGNLGALAQLLDTTYVAEV